MDSSSHKILTSYLSLLESLAPAMRRHIVSKFTKKLDAKVTKNLIAKSFGAWESKESAEDLANSLRDARNTNRKIEQI